MPNSSTEEQSHREDNSTSIDEVATPPLENSMANATVDSEKIRRKTRGPTRCLKIIRLQQGEKLAMEFDEDNNPIGDHATEFTSFLGQTVRNKTCCPLQVKSWKDIEEDAKDHMWQILLEKFTFEYLEERKLAIFRHMSALYRDYRHKLKKKYFNSKSSYQLRLKNKPSHVDADDWKYLVNHWHEATF
ncbi:hypothetical protein PTKIN_Ptkin02bG0090100 [Pterospermum kingtungense]